MSAPIRILFVDDEPNVLDGLLRLFRPRRHEWDMATAVSGAKALELLAQQPFDVVVSDMRMPGMDGAELLTRVAEQWPDTARFMLSGQSDREQALRRAGPCHHFLAKPCEPALLATLVTRSHRLRSRLREQSLGIRLAGRADLPALPRLYQRMLEELRRNEPSPQGIAQLIEQDLAMTARLLRVVNSAAFGLGRTVAGVAEAVGLVGIDTVRSLVLALHVFGQGQESGLEGLDADRLWAHCLAVARLARAIMQEERAAAEAADAAFTAGLLHDCGQPVLAVCGPLNYAAIGADHGSACDLAAAELAASGLRHDLVGAWMLHRWGLPDPVVETAAWHHDPSRVEITRLDALAAVHVADALLADEPAGFPKHLDETLIRRLDLDRRLEGWRRLAEALA